jgi:hypothetical protein
MKALLIVLVLFICSSVGTVEDEVSLEKVMDHVQVLVEYAPRLAGSHTADDNVVGGVYSAAVYIAETLDTYGYDVDIEEFPLTTFQITEVTVIVDFDGDFSTPDQLDLSKEVIPPTVRYADVSYDVTAPLIFLEESSDIEGKIPVFDYWLYYDPEYRDIAGHASLSLVYKEGEPAFSCRFREAFSISYDDYLEIKRRKTPESQVKVKFSSHSEDVKGYNVVGIKEGTGTTVVLTAHYDSVYTQGAIDNGSGVAALLETARILADKHTGALYFVFFDAEEIGLLGSEAFVASHDLPQSVCINVDSIASGDTVRVGSALRYENVWPEYYRTDDHLDGQIASIAEGILGYSPEKMYLEDAGGCSDFVTFGKVGIPSTNITTVDREAAKNPAVSDENLSEHSLTWIRGGKVVYFQEDRFSKVIPFIHTGFDDLNHVDEALFHDATRVVAEAAYHMSGIPEEVEPVYVLVIVASAVAVCILWYVRKSHHQ